MPRHSWAILLIPEFLIIKAPPKTTLLCFFITFLLIGSYVATHTSDLKPIRADKATAPKAGTDSLNILVPFHFSKPGIYNASIPTTVTWNPDEEIQPRYFDPNNNLDRLALMWRTQRAAVPGPNYELAVCFYGATRDSARTTMRWNAELDVSTFSSFDKFVMQGNQNLLGYDAILDPVAFVNVPYTPNPWLDMVSARLNQECTLNDWSRLVHSISTCAELLEYHTQKYGIAYRWAWITDPNVDWIDGAAPIDRSTAQPSLPDFTSLSPPSDSLFMRHRLSSASPTSTKLNNVPFTASSIPDPTSILGSYKNVIELSRNLKNKTDLLARANTPSNTPPSSSATDSLPVQQRAEETLRPIDLAQVVIAAAEALSLTISDSNFLPARNASYAC